QRPDKDHLAAAFGARQPQEPADLTDIQPVMRKAFDGDAIGGAAQREQDYSASAFRYRFRHRQRQAATTADKRERAVLLQVSHGPHVSSSVSPAAPRRPAMVSGRLPSRMKAIILATCSSLPCSASTRSSRARNSPAP